MSVFIAPIVEGHSEDKSIERLLQRVWNELLCRPERLQVLPAFRPKRDQLLQPNGLVVGDNVQKAYLKLMSKRRKEPGSVGLILILIDAEKDCPARLAPRLLAMASAVRSDAAISCVLAKQMFENWIAAGSATLGGVNGLPNPLPPVVNAEDMGGKAWVKQQLWSVSKNRAYSETLDCIEFVRAMDVAAARQNSSSFDKLCRELEKLLPAPPPLAPPPPDPPAP